MSGYAVMPMSDWEGILDSFRDAPDTLTSGQLSELAAATETEQAGLLDQALAAIQNKASGGGSGLPSCVTAMTSGSFSVDEDTADLTVPHSMGVAPDFLIWWTDEDFSATAPETTCAIGGYVTRKAVAGDDYTEYRMFLAYSPTNGVIPRGSNSSDSLKVDSCGISVLGYPIKTGYTYHYIVGALNNNP